MARLMIFNALSHNHDDHTKNFAFLCHDPEHTGGESIWTLAPAYDLTFSRAMGEHTTGFGGKNPENQRESASMRYARITSTSKLMSTLSRPSMLFPGGKMFSSD